MELQEYFGNYNMSLSQKFEMYFEALQLLPEEKTNPLFHHENTLLKLLQNKKCYYLQQQIGNIKHLLYLFFYNPCNNFTQI